MIRACLVLVLTTTSALAAIPSALAVEPECHANDKYVVIGLEKSDDVGTDFLVRNKATPAMKVACKFKPTDGDFAVGGPDEPLWFEALEGAHLVLTRSTGPQGMLVVYNLAGRVSVLDVDAEDVVVDPEGIAFWQPTGPGTAETCEQFAENEANGFGSVIQVSSRFSFTTDTVATGSETRCSITQ